MKIIIDASCIMADGEAIIKRSDGTSFKVIPETQKTASPFANVKPLRLKKKITREELLDIMKDSRESPDVSQTN